MVEHTLLHRTLAQLQQEYSYINDFFQTMVLPPCEATLSLQAYFDNLDPVLLADMGLEKESLQSQFCLFMHNMANLHQGGSVRVESVSIIGGRNKSGEAEKFTLTMNAGDVYSIVGPTGSGKSRLLSDIEWMAQKDTPTGRQILINGSIPKPEWRFSLEHKLVAQLSQNMNFVMDMNVAEFIRMHAESRMVEDPAKKIQTILHIANTLAGEEIYLHTPITGLSGGQSRALMIADTAFLSSSPIVLIDEIENAGVDRKKALELLIRQEKIVLMATHDPILALMASKRIVIKNGGIHKILDTSKEEKGFLSQLQELDATLLHYRTQLRHGERLSSPVLDHKSA